MPWLALDVAWIVLFAVVGRDSHGEAGGPLAVAGTAWPFLAGYVVGAVVARLPRAPLSIGRGAIAWLAAVAIGMAIRTVLEGRLPATAFVIVATAALGLGLVGWRTIALVARRRRDDAADAA